MGFPGTKHQSVQEMVMVHPSFDEGAYDQLQHKRVYLRAQGGRKAKRRAIRTPQVGEWIKNMWYDLTTGHIP